MSAARRAAIFFATVGAASVFAAACTQSMAPAGKASTAPGGHAASRGQVIDHLTPVRDSMGSAPTRFSWTEVPGADRYAIGIWTEVDVLVWRQDNVLTTSVTRPEEVRLEPGTYFWSVSALREGRLIAESGLAAFVVR